MTVSSNQQATAPTDVLYGPSVGDFWQLLKPRVMSLVIFTGFAAMFVAPGGMHPMLFCISLFAIAAGAGASGAINQWYDRDIDAVMARTRRRPVPSGAVQPAEALSFGVIVSVLSVLLLGLASNWLAAGLLAFTIFFYGAVYTVWLKRSTPQNIVIGGAAGALPPVIGWAAVTNDISIGSLTLFAIIFMWTPPHFWALAIRYRDDYQAADVPMLPAVKSRRTTATRIILYTVLLWGLTLAFAPVADMGAIYVGVAIVTGAVFLGLAVKVYRDPQPKLAMALFGWSITYVTLLFGAMAVDVMVRNGL